MDAESLKSEVLSYFIKSIPVGEHKEVLSDLQVVFGSDLIHTELISNLLLENLSSHGASIVHLNITYQLTPYSKHSGSQYLDPKHSVLFEVDPFDLLITSVSPFQYGTFFSKSLQEKLDTYIEMHFIESTQGRVFENDSEILIFLSSNSVNIKNMWTGEWISDWRLRDNKLKGHITLNAHYFEEGNFLVNQTQDFEVFIKSSSESEIVDEVIKAIKESDNQVQSAMYSIYENLPQSIFKSMRRTMPVTHTKFAEMNKAKMIR